ncbi:MAG: CHASE2 domain-containing protein [Candidatus Rokuibacteriota bacterium]
MPRPLQALLLGLITAATGLLAGAVPWTVDLEETFGLDLLFRFRGVRPPPAEVLVIAVERGSAHSLGLPPDPARWPRSLHARLIDVLARQGAGAIVFDLTFEQPQAPSEDHALDQAMMRAGNVVLAERLVRETAPLFDRTGGPPAEATIERLEPPLQAFAEAAVGLAPFPLPKVPARVSQYWTFKASAGDTPTLPVVALQVLALDVYDTFIRLFEQVSPYAAEGLPRDRVAAASARHVEELVRRIRELVQHEPSLAARMLERLDAGPTPLPDAPERRLLTALLAMYAGPSSQYLDFYGPPRTIPTVAHHEALAWATPGGPAAPDLRGKVVFVGLSEQSQPSQRDGFYTVFSQPSGLDLSGVEIAATAFANLLEGRPLRPLAGWPHLAVLVVYGVLVGTLARLLPVTATIVMVAAAALLYLIAAYREFATAAVWYPLVAPLLVQTPVAFLGGVLWRYSETDRERQDFRRALALYLPPRMADQIARHLADAGLASQLTYGTCLSTDAHQYSGLAERLTPRELGTLMNEYYRTMFEPVREHDGTVLDVVGDSMLAIWTSSEPDPAVRERACMAALGIGAAVERFTGPEGIGLPTRVGLHSGQFLLGNVGAIDHYEYRAVGDIVNTASRLQELNKHLGTRLLLSGDTVAGLGRFLTRELGTFLLAGKSRPVLVHELVCQRADATADQLSLMAAFADALAAYRDRFWKEACELFRECVRAHGPDGPSLFYAGLCERYAELPSGAPADAIVRMDRK